MTEKYDGPDYKVGEEVIMMNPGPEHLDEALYRGTVTTVKEVQGSDNFLGLAGKRTGAMVWSFPSRVKRLHPVPLDPRIERMALQLQLSLF